MQKRVQIKNLIQDQVPEYVRDQYPEFVEFLVDYYRTLEDPGGPLDIINNIDTYTELDQLAELTYKTDTTASVGYSTNIVNVSDTFGFPNKNGLIKIDQEIIHYESISNNSFINCTRGFSGITTYVSGNQPDQLTFNRTEAAEHEDNTTIQNLNVIFLQEFFGKLKNQIAPGFDDRQFFSDLDQRNFLYNVDSFYKSKGTDQSFKILFRALEKKTLP